MRTPKISDTEISSSDTENKRYRNKYRFEGDPFNFRLPLQVGNAYIQGTTSYNIMHAYIMDHSIHTYIATIVNDLETHLREGPFCFRTTKEHIITFSRIAQLKYVLAWVKWLNTH